MSTETQQLIDAFHRHMSADPNDRVRLGLSDGLDGLPDPSLAAGQRLAADADALLARNARQPRDQLDFDGALDLDLMALILRQRRDGEMLSFNGSRTRAQLPEAADLISDGIFSLFINDPRPAALRLHDIAARIAQIPDFLDGMLGRLEQPVRRWVGMEMDKIAALPELFATIVGWGREQGADWAGQTALERDVAVAGSALQNYAMNLRSLPTTDRFAIGEQAARQLVSNQGIDLDLAAIQQLARDFLARANAGIETLHARLCARHRFGGDTTVAELQQLLARRYAAAPEGPLSEILELYQAERERVLQFIEERALFPVPAGQDLKILQTPGFLAPSIPAGAMEPPAPFRDGTRTSLVYLTLSEELRAEHTLLGIPSMMVHEGIPGHHLQFAVAAMHPSVVRRHANFSHHAEGWTTMLEEYMLDQGYMGELTDECRFVTLRELSRLGARVAIDLFFMTGERDCLDVGVDCDLGAEDPFAAAGSLLAAVTGFVPERVEGELNWYSQARAYPLSYLVGNHLVRALREDHRAARSTELDADAVDREFHRVYLESGIMPVSFLRRVFAERGLL